MHSSSQIEQNGINSHAQDTNNFRPGVHKVSKNLKAISEL